MDLSIEYGGKYCIRNIGLLWNRIYRNIWGIMYIFWCDKWRYFLDYVGNGDEKYIIVKVLWFEFFFFIFLLDILLVFWYVVLGVSKECEWK